MATTSRITKHSGKDGLSVAVSVSKSYGNTAFRTTAVAPRQRAAQAVLADAKLWLNTNVPRDRGHLRASFDQDRGGTKIEVRGRVVRLKIASTVPYGAALDLGKRRRPGEAPPARNILRWMRRVGIGGGEAAAYAIARGIAKRGTVRGPNFASGRRRGKPTKQWSDGLVKQVRDSLAKIREPLVNETIEEILGRA